MKHFDSPQMFIGENLLPTSLQAPVSCSLSWAKPPHQEQQRTQRFQRKEIKVAASPRQRIHSSVWLWLLSLSSFSGPLPPIAHIILLDGSALKLTFSLQPLRHNLFLPRDRAHFPGRRWSSCKQVKLAGYNFQKIVEFLAKASP